MKRILVFILTIISALCLITGCVNTATAQNAVKPDGSFYKSGSSDIEYVELSKINDNLWVHVSYLNYNGNRTGSNGLVAISSKGIVLIDTPWNNSQTKVLLKLVKNLFNQDVTIAVITHAHEDRIGGIDALLENNIDVRSTIQTADQAAKNGFKKPNPKLDTVPNIALGDLKLETFYPGEGHSPDNITVWLPQYKVLFGGCLIKSMESKDKGSITDANLQQWPVSVKKVLDRYPNAETVIPGHGKWGGIQLIQHTLELLK